MGAQVLSVHAGPAARARLAERGLRPQDIGLIPAAAGGPKGLILNGLDRFLFGDWLRGQRLHLAGASIGAWRMATAALPGDAAANFAAMAEAYIAQHYPARSGEKRPRPDDVSQRFAQTLAECFGGREVAVLAHPLRHLHLVASRGQARLLRREGRWRTPLGYLAAFGANALRRRWLGGWLERVVFSDARAPLPLLLADLRSRRVALTPENLQPALLASCSIPFWLRAPRDVPGAPAGVYWDGGITDYHLHWDFRPLQATPAPLVLYPHFQAQVVPGWLDKALKHRHRPSVFLDNLVLLSPHPDFVRSLPAGKLPDRADFTALAHDVPERQRRWRAATAEGERLADALAALTRQATVQALPL